MPEKITVQFKRVRIGPDGEMKMFCMTQGENEITLTIEQALMLASQINERFRPIAAII